MKEQIKTPVLVAIVAVVVAVVAYFGFKSISGAGNLDQGQIKYTPGKPPWEEKGANGAASGAPAGAPAINNGP